MVVTGCVVLIGGLHVAKPALVPVMLAMVFALLLSTVVDRLSRRWLPRCDRCGAAAEFRFERSGLMKI